MNVTLEQGGNSVIFNTSHPKLAPYENNTSGYMQFKVRVSSIRHLCRLEVPRPSDDAIQLGINLK